MRQLVEPMHYFPPSPKSTLESNPVALTSDIETSKEAQNSSLSQFYPFSRFPIELRLMIWKLAAHEPRTLFLIYFPRFKLPYQEMMKGKAEIRDDMGDPAIMTTSQESRGVALKFYKQPFRQLFNRPTYFNFNNEKLELWNWYSKLWYRHIPEKIAKMEGLGGKNSKELRNERPKWLVIDGEANSAWATRGGNRMMRMHMQNLKREAIMPQ